MTDAMTAALYCTFWCTIFLYIYLLEMDILFDTFLLDDNFVQLGSEIKRPKHR
jgi:hypothetical protein